MNQITTAIDTLRCHLESSAMRLLAEINLSEQTITVRLGAELSYEFILKDTNIQVVVRQLENGTPSVAVMAIHAIQPESNP